MTTVTGWELKTGCGLAVRSSQGMQHSIFGGNVKWARALGLLSLPSGEVMTTVTGWELKTGCGLAVRFSQGMQQPTAFPFEVLSARFEAL